MGQLLLQDVECKDDGVSARDGVSRDRMPSVHDPELRHGHQSSRRRCNGHKAAIVVDTDSQLITAVDVLPGNAPDNLGALELVEASEASTGSVVEEAMGDAAYGDGGTRQTFAEAGRQLVAKVQGRPNRSHFPTNDFTLTWPRAVAPVQRDRLPTPSCRWESGQIAQGTPTACRPSSSTVAVCWVCPLRSQRIAAKGRQGRRVLIHPQEALLQQSSDYDQYQNRRVVAAHRLARLVQLGIRQPATSVGSRRNSSCIWRPRWPT